MKKKTPKTQDILVTVDEQRYRKQRASGLTDDEVLKPGVHRFRRGSFAKLHGIPEAEIREAIQEHKTKIGVYIKLDLDVLNFFKARAKTPGGLPYQTQINVELRKAMNEGSSDDVEINKLVRNEKLMSAIAARVKAMG